MPRSLEGYPDYRGINLLLGREGSPSRPLAATYGALRLRFQLRPDTVGVVALPSWRLRTSFVGGSLLPTRITGYSLGCNK